MFWAAAAPALIQAGGSLLGGLLGGGKEDKAQERNFANEMKLLQERTRLEQVGVDSPWRTVSWEGPLDNRKQVVKLNEADQRGLDQHRAYREKVMANWNPGGGWFDDERGELKRAPTGGVQAPANGVNTTADIGQRPPSMIDENMVRALRERMGRRGM